MGVLTLITGAFPYHIWEFEDGERGVETNLKSGGRQEELLGDYETELLELMKDWH